MRTVFLVTLVSLSLAACGASSGGPSNTLEDYGSLKDKGDTSDPVHGERTTFLYGAVLGNEGTNANGVGSVYGYADGTFVVTVNLNVVPRTDGKVFVAWLSDESESSVIKLGELRSIVGDVRHAVQATLTDVLPSQTHVLVSVESAEAVTVPSAVVAEGMLKAPSQPAS